jgi:hypothetical protein
MVVCGEVFRVEAPKAPNVTAWANGPGTKPKSSSRKRGEINWHTSIQFRGNYFAPSELNFVLGSFTSGVARGYYISRLRRWSFPPR